MTVFEVEKHILLKEGSAGLVIPQVSLLEEIGVGGRIAQPLRHGWRQGPRRRLEVTIHPSPHLVASSFVQETKQE